MTDHELWQLEASKARNTDPRDVPEFPSWLSQICLDFPSRAMSHPMYGPHRYDANCPPEATN